MGPSINKHLIYGPLWFGGGCLFTFITFSAASAKGGGFYIIASGAIFFGLLEFLFGVFLYFFRDRPRAQELARETESRPIFKPSQTKAPPEIPVAKQAIRPASETPKQFQVGKVASGLRGQPMLEIYPAPINRDGIPDLSEALATAIGPYIQGRDNISLRYIDDGLPTTTTAVISSITVEGDDVDTVYSLRSMVFETRNKKIGCNIHIQPKETHVKINGAKVGVFQEIRGARTYDFHEVYENAEDSRDDVSRLVLTAHKHFRGSGA